MLLKRTTNHFHEENNLENLPVYIDLFPVLLSINIYQQHYHSYPYDLYPLVHRGDFSDPRAFTSNFHFFCSFQPISPQINEEQSTTTIDSVFIPLSIDQNHHSLPRIEENIWPDVLSIDSPREQNKRFKSSSPIHEQIHTIVNNFKNQVNIRNIRSILIFFI